MQMARIRVDKENQERGMERWKEIVRRIEGAKPIEDRAHPSRGMRPRKGKAKRENEKANSGDDDRARHPSRIEIQLWFVREKKRRCDKKEIDREVGKNHEGNERDCPFPGEIKDAHLVPSRRNPEAAAVDQNEEKRKKDGDTEGSQTRNWRARFQG